MSIQEQINSVAEPPAVTYFPVSPRKFIALSVLTWGLYLIYWFYKNWVFIRDREKDDFSAVARGLFFVFSYVLLMVDLRKNLRPGPSLGGNIFLPIALLAIWLLGLLPDPFWLISILAFAPVLPALHHINKANQKNSTVQLANSQWKLRHWVLVAISGPALLLTAAFSTGLIPSTQVTAGWMFWDHNKAFLEKSGVLEQGERVIYFYSQDSFSFRSDGNFLTDRRLITYWTDANSGELISESARFDEVRDVRVERGDWDRPTMLTVVREDGSAFILVLSAESDRDRLFTSKLEEFRQAQAKPSSR